MNLPYNVENWNQLAQISYPLLADQMPTYDGGQPLPTGFVLDAWIATLLDAWEPHELLRIEAENTTATFVFAGTTSGELREVSVAWTGSSGPYVGRVTGAAYVAGIAVGDAARDRFEGLTEIFDCEGAVLEYARVLPADRLRLSSLQGTGIQVAGDVVLREGYGVRITSNSGPRPTITVSGIPGAGKGVPCDSAALLYGVYTVAYDAGSGPVPGTMPTLQVGDTTFVGATNGTMRQRFDALARNLHASTDLVAVLHVHGPDTETGELQLYAAIDTVPSFAWLTAAPLPTITAFTAVTTWLAPRTLIFYSRDNRRGASFQITVPESTLDALRTAASLTPIDMLWADMATGMTLGVEWEPTSRALRAEIPDGTLLSDLRAAFVSAALIPTLFEVSDVAQETWITVPDVASRLALSADVARMSLVYQQDTADYHILVFDGDPADSLDWVTTVPHTTTAVLVDVYDDRGTPLLAAHASSTLTRAAWPLFRADRVDCESSLLWINGLTADALGAVELIGGFGVRVTPDAAAHSLTISTSLTEDQLQCEGC